MIQVFEVDQALVLEFKRKIISGIPSTLIIPNGKHDGVCEARVVGVEADLCLLYTSDAADE